MCVCVRRRRGENGVGNRGMIRIAVPRWRGDNGECEDRQQTLFFHVLQCNLDVRMWFESKTIPIVGDKKRKSPVIRCLAGDCGLRDGNYRPRPLRCPRRAGSLVCIQCFFDVYT